MFTKDQIDFDKLHGEIRQVSLRQKELKSQGFKSFSTGYGSCHGWKAEYEDFVGKFKEAFESGRGWDYEWVKKCKNFFESAELNYLSCRMTVLCTILAHARGKVRHDSFWKNHGWYGFCRALGPIHHSDSEEKKMEAQRLLIGLEWRQFLKEKYKLENKREKEFIAAGFTKEVMNDTIVYSRPAPPVKALPGSLEGSSTKNIIGKVLKRIFG